MFILLCQQRELDSEIDRVPSCSSASHVNAVVKTRQSPTPRHMSWHPCLEDLRPPKFHSQRRCSIYTACVSCQVVMSVVEHDAPLLCSWEGNNRNSHDRHACAEVKQASMECLSRQSGLYSRARSRYPVRSDHHRN